MPQPKLRAIKEDVHFLKNVEQIFGSVEEGDKAQLLAVSWALSNENNWSHYPIIANTTHGALRALKTIGTKRFPSVTVFFTVSPDDETVWLHDITL